MTTGTTGTSFYDTGLTANGILYADASKLIKSLAAGAANSVFTGTGGVSAFTTTPRIVGLGVGAASTGSGLTFDGSSTLANYVDKTSFTPVIAFGGASVGVTYSTQSGTYMRIGNAVFFRLAIVLTSKGSSVGTMTVTGLPLTATASPTKCDISYGKITYTGNELIANVTASATTLSVSILTTAIATTDLADTNFANDSSLTISGFYFT